MPERPQLEIVDGPMAGTRFLLMGDSVVIGRVKECDICLDSLSGISRRHADIRMESDGSATLRDLESSNGTFVDGQRITTARIAPGQIFNLGPVRIRLAAHAAPGAFPLAAQGRNADKDMTSRLPVVKSAGGGSDASALPSTPDGKKTALPAAGAGTRQILGGIALAAAILLAATYASRILTREAPRQQDYPRLTAVGQVKLVPTVRPFTSFRLEPYPGDQQPVALREFDGLLAEAIHEVNTAHASMARSAMQLHFLVTEGLAPTGDQPAWISLSGPRGSDRIPVVVRGEAPAPPAAELALRFPQAERAERLRQIMRKVAWLEQDGHLYYALQECRDAEFFARSMGGQGQSDLTQVMNMRNRIQNRLKQQLSDKFRTSLLDAFPTSGGMRRADLGAAWQGLAEAKRLIPDERDLDWQVLDYWQAWLQRLHRERRR